MKQTTSPTMNHHQKQNRETSYRVISFYHYTTIGNPQEVMTELTPKERRILEMRYGLVDGVAHTLEEVGAQFGVTRERIRQIEAKVHEKLRNNTKIVKYKQVID